MPTKTQFPCVRTVLPTHDGFQNGYIRYPILCSKGTGELF